MMKNSRNNQKFLNYMDQIKHNIFNWQITVYRPYKMTVHHLVHTLQFGFTIIMYHMIGIYQMFKLSGGSKGGGGARDAPPV